MKFYERLRAFTNVYDTNKILIFAYRRYTCPRYCGDADVFHEAGYDSYCTGVVFLRICERSGLCTGMDGSIVLPSSSVNYLHIMQVGGRWVGGRWVGGRWVVGEL